MGLFSFSMSNRKKHGAYGGSGYYGAPKQGLGGMMKMFASSMSSSARKRMAYQQTGYRPHPAQQAPVMHARPVAQAGSASRCPRCAAQIPAGSKFCLECGQKVGGGFCAGCGKALPADARFCPECGTPQP
ncbi:MAG: zinc ribbon domain-containing protein [Slackia sp.]|nr:zinc ribbon domain-containing protein [Slackia sp.]